MNLKSVKAEGAPYEIGLQHGNLAKDEVIRNCEFYLKLWEDGSGIPSRTILDDAAAFIPYIEAFDTDLLQEIKGLADGVNLSINHIVALNSRWELNYKYIPEMAKTLEGCTSFALSSPATRNGAVFLGQNWDYKPRQYQQCLLLHIKQKAKPDIVLLTEAGIIGHKGYNSKGIGVALNFIKTSADHFKPGLPFLIKVRGILNSKNYAESINIITGNTGPNSGNLMLGYSTGETIDIECTPSSNPTLNSTDGILVHSNHFQSSLVKEKDTGCQLLPDTFTRTETLKAHFINCSTGITEDTIKAGLRNHVGYPDSICRHRREDVEDNKQWETVISFMVNLNNGEMNYCYGPPCRNSFNKYSL